MDAPVVVGGIIPDADQRTARRGRRPVYTPKDYKLAEIMAEIADLAIEHRRKTANGRPGRRARLDHVGVLGGMPRRLSFIVGVSSSESGEPLLAEQRPTA